MIYLFLFFKNFLQENDERMRALVSELKGKICKIAEGGGEKARQRHTSKGINYICFLHSV